MDIRRNKDENEEQFIWRLGQAKDNGTLDLSWDELASIINKEFRSDESEYRTEAAYRKPYQQAAKYYTAGVFTTDINSQDYISELQETKQEIRKEKQKLFDERVALNKKLRDSARLEEDLAYLASLIESNGTITLPSVYKPVIHSDNDLFISLSDFHLGLTSDSYFGSYNSDIAAERLSQYLQEIAIIQERHGSENAYVGILGDVISGGIHPTVRLQEREHTVEQVQKSAELISAFVYELSKIFTNVYVNSVSGNHSRTSMKKDEVLRGERLDTLIPWYMKAKLSHIDNIIFCEDNIDSTISNWSIRGHEYLLVHGDMDVYSEQGVSKLVMMLGYKPTAIFYGHLHRCSYDDISGVKIIRSGSFCGTVDDYTISKRLSGKASQMICVLDHSGVKTCYPIDLE
mgnify:CR=1 FL=1